MDNVTHALIGLIAGETVVRHSAPNPGGLPAPVRRTLLVAVAIIGSNSPDLDLLVSLRASAANHLDYMLWHRGYTHTVLGCLALALMLYAAAEGWLRLKHLRPSRRDRALLLGTALFTTALHLVMDFLNSYGVHPFWPAENRWSYGDSVFIVEPLYWVAAAPLFFLLRSRATRVLFASALISVIIFGLISPLVSLASCATLAASASGLLLLGARLPAHIATRLSAALGLGVTVVFVLTGRSAAHQAEKLAGEEFAQERPIDHVLTPMPVNPFCWDLLLLEATNERYIARHAILAIAPRMTAAEQCPLDFPQEHTAPLQRVALADTPDVRWLGEFSMSRTELKTLVDGNCDAAAFMKFARAPFVTAVGRVGPVLLGDLRFDHGRERGSFEVQLQDIGTTAPRENPAPCRRAAPWTAPRADLLSR